MWLPGTDDGQYGWRIRKVSAVPDADADGRTEFYPLDVNGKSVLDVSMEQARVDVAGGVACSVKLGLYDLQNMRRWVGPGLPEKMPVA